MQTPQIVKSLRRLQLSVPTPHDYKVRCPLFEFSKVLIIFHFKVNLLMTEILQAAPSVRGLGFFEVNQKLFPTVQI